MYEICYTFPPPLLQTRSFQREITLHIHVLAPRFCPEKKFWFYSVNHFKKYGYFVCQILTVHHNDSQWRFQMWLFFRGVNQVRVTLKVTQDLSLYMLPLDPCVLLFNTHHYIIFFVRPRHSKPGMESFCFVHQIETNDYCRPLVLYWVRRNRTVDYEGFCMVGYVYKSVKTLGALHS